MSSSSSYQTLVQELYVTYFGRPADAQGLQNFEAAMVAADAPTNIAALTAAYSTNAAVQTLIDSFGTSAESVLLYGQVDTSTSSATSFVTAVFENLLNRAPAAAGLNFWVSAITSGSVSLGSAALSIAAAAQANTTAQGLIDGTTIADKLTVASEFTTAVSNTEGIADYSGPAAGLVARSLLAGITANTPSDAYQSEVAQAVAALGAEATNNTYTLTTSTEALSGGVGSNTFNAVLDNAAGLAAGLPAATLIQGDAITPTGSDNVLSINDFGLGGTLTIPQSTISGITTLNLQSAESIGTMDFSTWSGLQTLEIGLSHGTDDVTVASGVTLTVNDTGAAGSITTNGGASVALYSDVNHSVTVNGGSATKTVSVTGGSNIAITDANYNTGNANVIASASITNPLGTTKIESNALTALTVTGDNGQNVAVDASIALTAPLTLTLDGDSAMTVSAPNILGLNVTTTNESSSGITLSAVEAGALSFDDSADLYITSLNAPGAIAVTIKGSGEFSANLSLLSGHADIDATDASGTVDVILNGAQNFAGGAGIDDVTVNSLSGSATGGSSGDNSIDFSGVTFSTASDLSSFSNFQTWEISGVSSGTLDMKYAGPYNNLIVDGSGGNITFLDLNADTPISLIASDSHAISLVFYGAENTGAVQDVTLGTAATTGITVGGLTIAGYANEGAVTVDLSSNSTSGQGNELGTLVDGNLATFNVSGNAPLSIGAPLVDAVSALTINDSIATSASAFAGLSDNALSSLTLNTYSLTLGSVSTSATSFDLIGNGAGAISIGGIVDTQLATVIFSETSTSTTTVNSVTIGASKLPDLQSLTLNGDIGFNISGVTYATGISLNGAGDNAAGSLSSSGATTSGTTDTIILGNGNDQITLGQGQIGSNQDVTLGTGIDSVTTASDGNVTINFAAQDVNTDTVTSGGNDAVLNVTAGNGNNQISATGSHDTLAITLGSGSNVVVTSDGASGSVTFGAHSGTDSVSVGVVDGLTSYSNLVVISGLNNAGTDSIAFSDTAGSAASIVQVTAANVTASGGNATSLSDWFAAAAGKGGVVTQTAHGLEWFQFGGNTYLIETSTANDTGKLFVTDSAVELTGTGYTFGQSTFSGGVLHLLG